MEASKELRIPTNFDNYSERSGGFEQELQDNYGASDYDMMMIFGTSASEQRQYLKDNPQFNGIVEPMGEYVEGRLRRCW